MGPAAYGVSCSGTCPGRCRAYDTAKRKPAARRQLYSSLRRCMAAPDGAPTLVLQTALDLECHLRAEEALDQPEGKVSPGSDASGCDEISVVDNTGIDNGRSSGTQLIQRKVMGRCMAADHEVCCSQEHRARTNPSKNGARCMQAR